MKILFVHQKFPAQFKHLVAALATMPGNQIVAMHIQADAPVIPGVRVVGSKLKRGNSKGVHPWLKETESKILRGEASWHTAKKLRAEGFVPDVIIAHPGWGESLFLKDVWPEAKLLCYFEYYYRLIGADVGFDPEFPANDDIACVLRLKNANNLLALEACDAGISPTYWQHSTHPQEFQQKIAVIHDGIDTDAIVPSASVSISLPGIEHALSKDDEIITFVSRSLEPYRGFHIFMRTLPTLLAKRPRAQVLIVGSVGHGYGGHDDVSWKDKLLSEVSNQMDRLRVHFMGQVSHEVFVRILQISSVHIYLTYPFVLSWSMLEAMSAGCLIVGSRTLPVEEVITDGENGLLVDFFSPDAIIAAIEEVFQHPTRMQHLRDAARRTVIERYDLKRICLPQQIAQIHELVKKH
ncbi:MAG: glycosyltransferase family 4 protein [Pseudomonadota bacterium]